MTFSPTLLGSGLAGFAYLNRTRGAQQALLAQTPEIARNTQAAKSRLETIQTAGQLLDDRAVLSVALGAFGLEEDMNNRAFIEKILTSDLSDDQSLANRLADKRYRDLAETFNFFGGTAKRPAAAPEDAIRAQLDALQTADDLLANPPLLRATLERFGLERDIGNVFFLQRVLESDPSDAGSFASRLSDPRYAELAATFGLTEKRAAEDSIYGFASRFSGRTADLRTADDLLDNDDLLRASLRIFGLNADAPDKAFLASVLNSDLGDDGSVANRQTDPRYAAWADVFGFAERAGDPTGTFVPKLERFVETVSSRRVPAQSAKDFLNDPRLMLAAFDFFDLPLRSDSAAFANRLIASDPQDPTSLVNVLPDPRLKPFVAALNIPKEVPKHSYPTGFADSIVKIYLDRQFEVQVGQADPNMRLALGLGRDLRQVVANQRSNDAQWFAVLASNPLREVFETALNTPDSFNRQDIDRQRDDLKRRAMQRFGTDRLADFTAPDALDALRSRFLLFADLPQAAPSPSLSILRGAASSGLLASLYGK